MRIGAVTLSDANDYVERFHRHNGRLPGAKFAIAACTDQGDVIGVAIAGLPKARMLADGGTLEVNRVCSDGGRNVCSALYGACIRGAKALGYWRAITYTLETESGASLRASGWTKVAASGGGSWIRPNQPTRNGGSDEHDLGAKFRWEVTWADPFVVSWPQELASAQDPGLF